MTTVTTMPQPRVSDVLNEKLYQDLVNPESETVVRARDAVNAFTRSFMYHRFTGMPKRGIMRRIMPPIPLLPLTELVHRGWPYAIEQVYDQDGVDYAAAAWETGVLYYEVAEYRLSDEDYQRRLRCRRVARREWYHAEHYRRLKAKQLAEYHLADGEWTYEAKIDFFEATMTRVLGQVYAAAERRP